MEGDILVRCLKVAERNSRQTMFRVMFHTSFIENHCVHFNKRDLDFAHFDTRFTEEFSVDLIFSADEEEVTSDKQFWKSIARRQRDYPHDAGEGEQIDSERLVKRDEHICSLDEKDD
jgi:hypothetical protein